MAIRSTVQRNSLFNNTVRLVLLMDINLNITGRSSGKVYSFSGAGTIQNIDKEDVDFFLDLKQGGCCGSVANPYFEIVR